MNIPAPVAAVLLAWLCTALVSAAPAQRFSVQSPDGQLRAEIFLADGSPCFEVTRAGRTVLERSPLGLETSLGALWTGFTAAESSSSRSMDEHYTLPHGKVREVHYRANEMTTRFTHSGGAVLEVIFRVSDRDVAFAMRVSAPEKQRIIISRERTGFNLPGDATAFVTHQAAPGDGWMGTKPSYEEPYLLDVPVGTRSPTGLGFTFPALFRLGADGWVLISETGVSSHYAGCRLGDPTADSMYPIAFPEAGENGGVGETGVSAALPARTPWRTLTIGSTLAPIVESTVATDVVEPLYEPGGEFKPGRASWSWLLWQDPSMSQADQRAFIDLAAAMKFEYILIDALWDTAIGRSGMAALVEYARSRDVGVLLWYNSNGAWNDAPQTPRNRLDTAPARDAEMAWLQSIGVKGLKVDFFGGDKQVTMKLYEDILTAANRHGLMLNFHGATLPRGWERMYPNHMTSEAVTASENLVFSQDFADREARNSTIFPFTRNAVAAMDYGPVVLNRTFARDPARGNIRRTTDAFQLATAVLYQSPLQHFGLTPENLREQPGFVLGFLKQVPAAWDETRFLAGYPGREVALARRHGSRWYIAATNGESVPKQLALTLPELAGRTVTLIGDGPDGACSRAQLTIGPGGAVPVTLQPHGGAVLFEAE